MSKDVDFEKAMADLEGLVKTLEAGDMPLAKALEDFEKGVRLVKQCQTHLDQAKAQVDALMAEQMNEQSNDQANSDQSSETSG
ncbi:MAG: exodeoxyribonuclease VII small subunit [Wenzhouxiangella sp.]|jgi:exodeoxyribonuclease VII small subunit|nr:exodeoxyribonuclease VII small subunit [Wenzhouxiangella sp.]MDR9452782.1 exodeoxyribonuclease VII small subunit [Wenzhouxiangella sp.]